MNPGETLKSLFESCPIDSSLPRLFSDLAEVASGGSRLFRISILQCINFLRAEVLLTEDATMRLILRSEVGRGTLSNGTSNRSAALFSADGTERLHWQWTYMPERFQKTEDAMLAEHLEKRAFRLDFIIRELRTPPW